MKRIKDQLYYTCDADSRDKITVHCWIDFTVEGDIEALEKAIIEKKFTLDYPSDLPDVTHVVLPKNEYGKFCKFLLESPLLKILNRRSLKMLFDSSGDGLGNLCIGVGGYFWEKKSELNKSDSSCQTNQISP